MPLKTLLQRVGQAKVPNSYVPDTNWGSNEPMLRSDRVNRLLMCEFHLLRDFPWSPSLFRIVCFT